MQKGIPLLMVVEAVGLVSKKVIGPGRHFYSWRRKMRRRRRGEEDNK